MSKQTATNVSFILHIRKKLCTYRITTFWFSLCDFPLMRVFPSPKMRKSRGPPVFINCQKNNTIWQMRIDYVAEGTITHLHGKRLNHWVTEHSATSED